MACVCFWLHECAIVINKWMLSVAHHVDSGDRIGLPRQAVNTALKHNVVSVFVYKQSPSWRRRHRHQSATSHYCTNTRQKHHFYCIQSNIYPLQCFRIINSDHFCYICSGKNILYSTLWVTILKLLWSLRAIDMVLVVFICSQYRHFGDFILPGMGNELVSLLTNLPRFYYLMLIGTEQFVRGLMVFWADLQKPDAAISFNPEISLYAIQREVVRWWPSCCRNVASYCINRLIHVNLSQVLAVRIYTGRLIMI